jgi:hypothetical protein
MLQRERDRQRYRGTERQRLGDKDATENQRDRETEQRDIETKK